MKFNLFQTIAWFVLAAFWLALGYHFEITLNPTLPIIPLGCVVMGLGCAVRSGLYLGDLLTLVDEEYC